MKKWEYKRMIADKPYTGYILAKTYEEAQRLCPYPLTGKCIDEDEEQTALVQQLWDKYAKLN